MRCKNYKWVVCRSYDGFVLCETEQAVKDFIDEAISDGEGKSGILVFNLNDAIPFKVREVEISLR